MEEKYFTRGKMRDARFAYTLGIYLAHTRKRVVLPSRTYYVFLPRILRLKFPSRGKTAYGKSSPGELPADKLSAGDFPNPGFSPDISQHRAYYIRHLFRYWPTAIAFSAARSCPNGIHYPDHRAPAYLHFPSSSPAT